jgi:hypothetical protein
MSTNIINDPENEQDEDCLKCGAEEAPHHDHTGHYCGHCWENATYCCECDAVVWMDECFVDDETGECFCEKCRIQDE